jgi:hypothetical protein
MLSNERSGMRVATRLVIAMMAFGLIASLSARQTTVIINLTEQAAYLLEDGRLAFISPIASGKENWDTPAGHFRVISKDLNHQSGNFGLVTNSSGRIINSNATPNSYVPRGGRYSPAPMPYFMEFRKYVGMHAGFLPGYPASHGCVRMPRDLAAEFFARVQVGTPVKVIGNARNLSRLRKAIPIVQAGNSAPGTSFLAAGQAPAARTRTPNQVRKAIPVVQQQRGSRYASAFLFSGRN